MTKSLGRGLSTLFIFITTQSFALTGAQEVTAVKHFDSLQIIALNPIISDKKVKTFTETLILNKADFLNLYDITSDEYNELLSLSLAILGVESKFFQSKRYKLKESFQWAVTGAKILRHYVNGTKIHANSRGPTQIKVIPQKVEKHFQISEDNLNDPRAAALATMGYLIEALDELTYLKNKHHLDQINDKNYSEYLAYIYMGSRQALIENTATPDHNDYIKKIRYYKTWFVIYKVGES